MNLILDQWLRIRTASGKVRPFAPLELSRMDDSDPPTQLVAPRADFRQAQHLFLVAAVQTACMPANIGEWRDALEDPGVISMRLLNGLERIAPCFELTGETAFMQDMDPLENQGSLRIESLLIDTPGGKTLRDNTDFFTKRARYTCICPACTASALYALQQNAPSGGQGHRTGLRGGGPITAFVVSRGDPAHPDTGLWEAIWLNVLETNRIRALFPCDPSQPLENAFPWMLSTPTSEEGETLVPDKCHPMHVYWSMPRRIRLGPAKSMSGACSLCGEMVEEGFETFRSKNHGINYGGSWRHPLSAYYRKDNEWLAYKGQPGGILYRSWPSYCLPPMNNDTDLPPEPVNRLFMNYSELGISSSPILRAGGYDMDNMKARCWYETEMPVYFVPPESCAEIRNETGKMTSAAREVSRTLRKQIFKAWGGSKEQEGCVPPTRLWQETEADFHRTVRELIAALQGPEEDSDDRMDAALQGFARALIRKAQDIFDELVLAAAPEAIDIRRVTDARRELAGYAWHNCRKAMLLPPKADAKQAVKESA